MYLEEAFFHGKGRSGREKEMGKGSRREGKDGTVVGGLNGREGVRTADRL
jgi:hypothetical protein